MSSRKTDTYWRLTEVASEWLREYAGTHYLTSRSRNPTREAMYYTYNVTPRRVRVTIVVVEKQ